MPCCTARRAISVSRRVLPLPDSPSSSTSVDWPCFTRWMHTSVLLQFLARATKRGLGETGPDVRTAHDHPRIVFAALQPGQNPLQIRQHAVG